MMKQIEKTLPNISLMNGFIKLEQGDNFVALTKNDVNVLRMLHEGKFEGCYTSSVTATRFRLMNDNSILATCEDNNVYISMKAIKFINRFREAHSSKIKWDMDFKRWMR